MEVGIITNPNSKKNRKIPDRTTVLQAIVGNWGEVHQTARPEDIKPILRDFLRRRAKLWVSDGGDGALHWMLRMGLEVLEEDEFAQQGGGFPLTLPTNGGSIDFVAHNVGIKGNAESILRALVRMLEKGGQIEEVEVDSMQVEGVQVINGEEHPFRTLGFASAAGGVGQRFFTKLFEAGNHTTRTIILIAIKTVASYPIAMSPLRHIPGMPDMLRHFANDVFKPTMAKITVDGLTLPRNDATGIHIASMTINLGGVFAFFNKADVPGQLHVLAGSPTPLQIIRNLPRMHFGREMIGSDLIDQPCREMTIEAVGDELLGPVIDGEYYPEVRTIRFSVGPRVRIPKVVGVTPRN